MENHQTTKKRAGLSVLTILGVFTLLILGAYFLTIDNQKGTRVTDIIDNTSSYAGKQVAILAEVDDVVGTRGIVVDQEGSVLGDEILVISRQPLEPVGGGSDDILFDEGKDVQISGEVQSFNRINLQNELGIILDEDAFRQWEGKPVIVADTLVEAN